MSFILTCNLSNCVLVSTQGTIRENKKSTWKTVCTQGLVGKKFKITTIMMDDVSNITSQGMVKDLSKHK